MFPDFNRWSLPLLILVIQGFIFACLLLSRYKRKGNTSDLYLSIILITSCYSQICYTLGFMGWYNEFRATKINYFLLDTTFVLAPLIFFYLKSITTSHFKFRTVDWWHFAPILLFIVYRICIFSYDDIQPQFDTVQNGVLKLSIDEPIVLKALEYLSPPYVLLYLAFTFQLFYNYRKKIMQYFSNTFTLELNWILSFLILFTIAFLYNVIQSIVGNYIDLGYQQRWWLNLLVAIITLYFGIKGYFTDTSKLKTLSFSFFPSQDAIPNQISSNEKKPISKVDLDIVKNLMDVHKSYLNPELNLSDLADQAHMSRAQLSEIINSGFGKNFNDFVNEYRVEAFKAMLKENKHEQLSLLGIAQDCGFNSKATFNRVFKKLTNVSPTQYLKS